MHPESDPHGCFDILQWYRVPPETHQLVPPPSQLASLSINISSHSVQEATPQRHGTRDPSCVPQSYFQALATWWRRGHEDLDLFRIVHWSLDKNLEELQSNPPWFFSDCGALLCNTLTTPGLLVIPDHFPLLFSNHLLDRVSPGHQRLHKRIPMQTPREPTSQ